MATPEKWREAFRAACDALPEPFDIACPNCGRCRLRLVFTGNLNRGVGYAQFWCDNCLNGIGISRTFIPDGAVTQDIRLPVDERLPKIPNFRLVT